MDTITVETRVAVPARDAWKFWTDPEHIIHWNNASEDWYTPYAKNDLKTGGSFSSRMEARDGSAGFDFSGKFTNVEPFRKIEYKLDDGRKVEVDFFDEGESCLIRENFEAENMNSTELQKQGWQAIIDNFRKYTESRKNFKRLRFEVSIDADTATVYRVLIDKNTFTKWTVDFNPSSHYTGSWEKGGMVHFLGESEDGNDEGMVGTVRENIPERFISVEYTAVLKGGKEISDGEEAEPWKGGFEKYSLKEMNGKTQLEVFSDAPSEFVDFFLKTWPKALKKLKSLCENK